MDWIYFAFLTAIFNASASLTQKKVLFKQHALEFAFILSIFNFIISIPLFLTIDYSKITFLPIFFTFFVTFIAAVAFLLIAKSVRHLEVSESSPLLVIGPGITAILAFAILGETLTLVQIIGILLLIVGAYALEMRKHVSIFEPFEILKKSRYAHYILFALVLYSITGVFDKIVTSRMGLNINTYIAFVHLFLLFHFFIFVKFFKFDLKEMFNHIKINGWLILVVAFFTVGYRYSSVLAIRDGNVGLVSAIKRSSAFLVVLVGGELFHEHNLMRKIIACCILILGVILIVI